MRIPLGIRGGIVALIICGFTWPAVTLAETGRAPRPAAKRSREKSRQAPTLFPARPPRPDDALKTADDRLNEMLELASFPTYWAFDDLRKGALAFAPRRDYLNEIDTIVRFDRLTRTADAKIKSAAETFREVWQDNWRINRYNQAYGLTPEFFDWQRSKTFSLGLAVFASHVFDGMMAPDGEVIGSYRDSVGELQEIRAEPVVEPSDLTLELEGRFEAALAGEGLEQRRYIGALTELLRDELLDRAAASWRDVLLPAVEHRAAQDENPALLEFGLPQKMCRDVLKRDAGYGAVSFRSRQTLHHVTVAVVITDEAGTARPWFTYFEELPASQTCTSAMGGRASRILEARAKHLTAECSVYCDEGRRTGVQLDLGEPPAERDELYPEMFMQLEPDEPNDVVEFANGRKELNGRPIKPGDVRRQTWEGIREHFHGIVNPETVRPKLLRALDAPARYTAIRELAGKPRELVITIKSLDEQTGIVAAVSRVPEFSGEQTHQLIGMLVEEPERGCVLGFVTVSSDARRKFQAQLAAREREMALLKKLIEDTPDTTPKGRNQLAQAKRRLALLEKKKLPPVDDDKVATAEQNIFDKHRRELIERARRIVTAPVEIATLRPVSFGDTKSSTEAEIAVLERRYENSDLANLVLFLNHDGQLTLQSPPNEAGFVSFAPVQRAPLDAR